MSQSPETAVRRGRYEDGWEAINRMIREDGSWSGRERNCLLLGCADGTFVDASAASGVDFIEDGRAFAVLDYDQDGDPDIVLRSRNGPRLRILKNVYNSGNHSIWFHLTGVRGNRDAIGARVELETSRGRRSKAVEAGSGFLSQHTRWIWFGLGAEETFEKVRIRWPSGQVQELLGLAADRRYRVVEGERPVSHPFLPEPSTPLDPAARDLFPGAPPQDSPLVQAWLVDPLPAPDFRLPDLEGRPHALSQYRGKPLVLLFLSPECGACAAEVEDLRAEYERIEGARGSALGITLGKPGHPEKVRERFGNAPFPVLIADEKTAAAWNAIHRSLFNRYRNLAVPTTFLLGPDGRIEKVYRGRTAASDFQKDILSLKKPAEERFDDRFPFGGKLLGSGFHRDLFLLGAALTEAGAVEEAAQVLRGSLSGNPADAEALYNLGMALAAAGDAAGAARAYREALSLRPDMVDALNNLGVLEASAGRARAARDLFQKALEGQPGYAEAVLNLARTHLEEGDTEAALRLYQEALKGDSDSVPLWQALGYAHYRRGELDEGIAAYLKARALAPADPDAAVGLVNLLLERGARADLPEAKRIAEEGVRFHPRHVGLLNGWGLVLAIHEDFAGAERAYHRAIEAEPQNAGPYLNLARLRLKTGDRPGAAKALRNLLKIRPGHPEAEGMLARLSNQEAVTE